MHYCLKEKEYIISRFFKNLSYSNYLIFFHFLYSFKYSSMVRRRNIQSKRRLSSKKISRRGNRTIQQPTSTIVSKMKQTPSENLDDETKLAKRHLTKEMWQLVSIAVKRMADELSNNQQTTATIPNNHQTTFVETNNVPVQSTETPTIQEPMITNTGAGDEPVIKEKSTVVKEPIKQRTLPLQMLEPSLRTKKKGSNNNATRRSIKSKIQNKSSKKNRKTMTQRLRNNYKLK